MFPHHQDRANVVHNRFFAYTEQSHNGLNVDHRSYPQSTCLILTSLLHSTLAFVLILQQHLVFPQSSCIIASKLMFAIILRHSLRQCGVQVRHSTTLSVCKQLKSGRWEDSGLQLHVIKPNLCRCFPLPSMLVPHFWLSPSNTTLEFSFAPHDNTEKRSRLLVTYIPNASMTSLHTNTDITKNSTKSKRALKIRP